MSLFWTGDLINHSRKGKAHGLTQDIPRLKVKCEKLVTKLRRFKHNLQNLIMCVVKRTGLLSAIMLSGKKPKNWS